MAERSPIAWPPLESQIETALERIAGRERARSHRPWLALAAAAAIAVAAALAAPPVRSAFLRVLHIGRERVEIVDRLPALDERAPLALGRRVTLDEARAVAPFALVLPDFDRVGTPDSVYVQGPPDDPQISLLWGTEHSFVLLLTETRAQPVDSVLRSAIARKRLTVPPKFVFVNGRQGLWLSHFHEYLRVDSTGNVSVAHGRIARNVLLWDERGLALRIEGRLSLTSALAIAHSLS